MFPLNCLVAIARPFVAQNPELNFINHFGTEPGLEPFPPPKAFNLQLIIIVFLYTQQQLRIGKSHFLLLT